MRIVLFFCIKLNQKIGFASAMTFKILVFSRIPILLDFLIKNMFRIDVVRRMNWMSPLLLLLNILMSFYQWSLPAKSSDSQSLWCPNNCQCIFYSVCFMESHFEIKTTFRPSVQQLISFRLKKLRYIFTDSSWVFILGL